MLVKYVLCLQCFKYERYVGNMDKYFQQVINSFGMEKNWVVMMITEGSFQLVRMKKQAII